MNKIGAWANRKICRPILDLLKTGLSPEKLALTIAFGAILGVIPIIGATTILVTSAAILFRLNIAVIQLINWVVYPLQLILFIPFIKIGNYFYGSQEIPSLELLLDSPLKAVQKFWFVNLLGVGAWALISLPAFILLYYSCLYLLIKAKGSKKSL